MVGRSQELAQVRAALVGSSAGAGRLVLISGAPGIGKTSLVSAVTAMAQEYGVPVTTGYAIDDAGMPPLWPWARIARDVPGLAKVLAPTAGPAAMADSAVARFTMHADACQALADAATETGLLVVLEDIQWADRSSLLLLRHLAGELARTRVLVVATCRDTGSTELTELLPDLLRAEDTRSIRLAGLTPPDIGHWLRLRGFDGEAEQADRLWARTGGNPLFVRMLLDRGSGAESAELRQLVLAQLNQLDADVRDLLDAASVLGERLEPSLLAEVTGLPATKVDALLDQAVAHGVLVSTPDTAGLSFAHALVRDAVYEQLAPSRRTTMHEQAAIALERTPRPQPGLVANHWRRSGAPGWAGHCLRWARLATRAAATTLAYDEAARFAALALHAAEEDALDAGVRAELAVEVAKAEFVAGRVDACLVRCQAAGRLAHEAGRPDLVAAAALVITGMGDPDITTAVDQLCDTAIQVLPASEVTLHARLRARQAIAAAESDAGIRARELSAQALELAERDGDPDALLDCLQARHLSLCAPQFLAERRAVATRACALAHRAQQPIAELWGHVWLVDAAFQAGDLTAVDQELSRIEQVAVKGEHPIAWWHLHRLRATRSALIGDLDLAEEHNESARAVAERIGAISTTGMYYAFLGQLALLRGTLDREVGTAILEVLRGIRAMPLVRIFIPQTHLLLGETDLARATFEEFRHMPATMEPGPRWVAMLTQIGHLACVLDDAGTADRVHHELAQLEPTYAGDGSGIVFSGGSVQRLVADLALMTGRFDEAIERYTDAIAMNARIGARPFVALGRLGLAKALLAKGDHAELPTARELVTDAAAEFRRLGLPGPLASADATLAAVDAATRASNPLSPREGEVAARIAQAKSNREIARELVLSERTVETHVRNILAKLGYSTRTEIATWSLTKR